jgi:transcriptional regulator with XRE-family HTH domain
MTARRVPSLNMAAVEPTLSAASFGAAVRQLRVLQGMTAAQLGERSGIARATIEALELGEHVPDLAELHALGEGLGMTISAIVRVWENEAAFEGEQVKYH